MKSTPPRLIALAVILLTHTSSLLAHAGELAFSGAYPVRLGTTRLPDLVTGPVSSAANTSGSYGINRADCLGISGGVGADTRWQFAIAQPTIGYQYLEVWARTDGAAGCADAAARGLTGLAPICGKVASFPASQVNASQSFEIPDVAIIAAVNSAPKRMIDGASGGFSSEKAGRETSCNVG